jgi:hypothetical protein
MSRLTANLIRSRAAASAVLVVLGVVVMVALPRCLWAQADGVRGSWIVSDWDKQELVFELVFHPDDDLTSAYSAFSSLCFPRPAAGRRRTVEQGTYLVSGDSVLITIKRSDVAERVAWISTGRY